MDGEAGTRGMGHGLGHRARGGGGGGAWFRT